MLYVPELRKNLSLIDVVTSKDFEVLFKGNTVEISKDKQIFAQRVKQENDIFLMFFRIIPPKKLDEVNVS